MVTVRLWQTRGADRTSSSREHQTFATPESDSTVHPSNKHSNTLYNTDIEGIPSVTRRLRGLLLSFQDLLYIAPNALALLQGQLRSR